MEFVTRILHMFCSCFTYTEYSCSIEQSNEDSSSTSNSMLTSSFDLPEDIWNFIFTRFSVKSLMQFSCVSKSWHAFITNQDFAELHLNRYLTGSTPQNLMFREIDSNSEQSRLVILRAEFTDPENCVFNEMLHLFPPNELFETKSIRLIGSCNGLLAFWSFKPKMSFFVFCNPLTGSYWTLPSDRLGSDGRRFSYSPEYYFSGFGYDDIHNEYKVVRFILVNGSYEVEVYGFKSNYWKIIPGLSCNICPRYLQNNVSGVLVDCTLNWISKSNRILSIDLRKDQHTILSPPRSVDHKYLRSLSELNGRLCSSLVSRSEGLDLWILKDCRVEDSWTRIIVVRSFDKWVWDRFPVVNLERTKVVVFQDEQEIVWYDQVQNRVMFKRQIPHSLISYSPRPVPFIGSLVQPWRSKGKENAWGSLLGQVIDD